MSRSETATVEREAFHLAPQGRWAEPQELGGTLFVPPGRAKRTHDRVALGVLHDVRKRSLHQVRAPVVGVRNDVLELNLAVRSERHPLLDEVFELSNVPGEVLAQQIFENARTHRCFSSHLLTVLLEEGFDDR